MVRMMRHGSKDDWLPRFGYSKVVKFIKRSQILLSILIGILISMLPEIRSQIQEKPVRYILVSMSFEILMFAIVSWVFGMKRVPANYVSLIFLRFYVFFDCKYIHRIDLQQSMAASASALPVSGKEQVTSSWLYNWINNGTGGMDKMAAIPLIGKLESEVTECCGGDDINGISGMYRRMYVEKFLFAVMVLTMTGLVTIYSKIDISRCEWLALSLIAVGTSVSTVILISSMAIDRVGKDYHCTLCKVWTMIAFVAALFTFVFATQRLYKRARGKISSNARYYRTQAELLIFAINVCVAIYYIPVIHPGFSFYNTIVNFPKNVATLTPDVIRNTVNTVAVDVNHLIHNFKNSVTS